MPCQLHVHPERHAGMQTLRHLPMANGDFASTDSDGTPFFAHRASQRDGVR